MIEELKIFYLLKIRGASKRHMENPQQIRHFTYTFYGTVLDSPDPVFVEDIDERLFKECSKTYFTTIDLLYCILCWRFEGVRERMREVIN